MLREFFVVFYFQLFVFLTFFSAQARVLFWFHGVLFCASSFWPIICSCISLARSLTQFLDSLSLPLPDCVLRFAYYWRKEGRGEWPLWEMGKGFIAGLWLLCFLRFFVLFLLLLLPVCITRCRCRCCCCSFVLGFGLTLLTLIPKERRHLGDFSLPFLLQRFI